MTHIQYFTLQNYLEGTKEFRLLMLFDAILLHEFNDVGKFHRNLY